MFPTTRALAIFSVLLGTVTLAQVPKVSRVAATEPLSTSINGIDGKIELLEDARTTPALQAKLWQTGQLDGGPAPDVPGFETREPRNALLRVVDRDGMTRDQHPLKRPLAKLTETLLYTTSRPTYLLTVDYSAGFGSYNGPITSLWEVTDASSPRRGKGPKNGRGGSH